MNNFHALVIAYLLAIFAPVAKADFELGLTYYQAKNFEKAYKEFLYSGELGDKDSQFNLGVMHYRGEFTPKSLPKAYAWLSLANQPRLESAEKTLGIISKKMTPEDIAAGEVLLKDLTLRYSESAIQKRMAPNTAVGSDAVEQYKSIRKITPVFPSSALKDGQFGIVDASMTVAKDGSVRDIQILVPNPEFNMATIKAIRQWQYLPATKNGMAYSTYGTKVRINYAAGGAASLDAKKLNKHLSKIKEKALGGTSQDKYAFALQTDALQSMVSGIYKEEKEKAKVVFENPNTWYYQAAVEGMPVAELQMGMNMLAGRMCTLNTDVGLGWIERAASKGTIDAQYQLGATYYEGGITERDTTKGIYWLDKASKNGFANASVKLAWIYATSTDASIRDAAKAKTYIAQVKDDHPDQLSYWEAQAAVAAAAKDFPSAIKSQQKAVDLATEYGLNLPTQKLQLAKYEAGQPWVE